MKTYKEVYEEAVKFLTIAEIENASIDAWYLMEHVTGLTRAKYFLSTSQVIADDAYEQYRRMIDLRATHVPLQYIIGEQEFMGFKFRVNEAVLIPRQDTEILVEQVLRNSEFKSVLDMCTGSGCIIISLAKLSKLKYAAASDLSKEALDIAKINAENIGANITFYQGDMFEKVTGTYDIIVSNPPYIKEMMINELMPEVRDHEPYQALSGDVDGLKFYKVLAKEASHYLNAGGELYLEIGYDQAEQVRVLLEENGFVNVRVVKDYAGLDRALIAKLNSE